MTKTIPFQSVVDALLNTAKPFPKKSLAYFSDIDPASLDLLMEAWPRITLTRKRNLLADLDAMLDADTIVSFDDFGRALLNDPDAIVRASAIRLLREYEDPKRIPPFVKLLTGDPDPVVRAEAARALNIFVAFGELESIPESSLRQVEEALLAAEHDDDANVRRRALESLGFSSRDEVPALIESALARQDPDWNASALIAMGRSNDDRWAEPVVRMLVNDNRAVRLAAVEAAGMLGLDAARIPLLRLVQEENDQDIFSAAIWSLSEIGSEEVRPVIINLLDQTDDEDEIEFLEDALANLSFTEDLAQFDLLAYDPDEDFDDLEDSDEDEK